MLSLFELGKLTHISQKTQRQLLARGLKNMKQVKDALKILIYDNKISDYSINEIEEFINNVQIVYKK